MLTPEQKKTIISLVKDNTEAFVSPLNMKIKLPVVVGYEDILDADGKTTGEKRAIEELHDIALVDVVITRHDCTVEPRVEYDAYEFISL